MDVVVLLVGRLCLERIRDSDGGYREETARENNRRTRGEERAGMEGAIVFRKSIERQEERLCLLLRPPLLFAFESSIGQPSAEKNSISASFRRPLPRGGRGGLHAEKWTSLSRTIFTSLEREPSA